MKKRICPWISLYVSLLDGPFSLPYLLCWRAVQSNRASAAMLKKTAPGWREAAGTARSWLAAAGTARSWLAAAGTARSWLAAAGSRGWGSEGWRTPGLAARFAFACPTAVQRRAANCTIGEGRPILVNALLKPNSWTYRFVEVSGHKLESSQTQSLRIQLLYYKPVSNQFWSRGGE